MNDMIEITEADRKAAELEVQALAQRDDKILVGAELGPFIKIAAERNALRRLRSGLEDLIGDYEMTMHTREVAKDLRELLGSVLQSSTATEER